MLEHDQTSVDEAYYHVVLDGSCSLELFEGPELSLNSGDIVLLPRGAAHVLKAIDSSHLNRKSKPSAHPLKHKFNGAVTVRTSTIDGGSSLDLLCGRFIYAAGALLIDALPDVVKVSFAYTEIGGISVLVKMMREEAIDGAPGARTVLSALSTALFTMVVQAHLAAHNPTRNVFALLVNARIGPSVIAMLERPAERWTIDSLATLANMSRATYIRAFSALTDISPITFLTSTRMQMARVLLSRTSKTIGQVAGEVGYESESAFAKNFKMAFGVAPGSFRKMRC